VYYWRVYSPSDPRIDVRGTARTNYGSRLYTSWILQILDGLLGHVPDDVVKVWSREDCAANAFLLPHHPVAIASERRMKVS